jgi:hypothetical protein
MSIPELPTANSAAIWQTRVTGGGLHGKDLSKADVSINIYAFLKAQETGKPVDALLRHRR